MHVCKARLAPRLSDKPPGSSRVCVAARLGLRWLPRSRCRHRRSHGRGIGSTVLSAALRSLPGGGIASIAVLASIGIRLANSPTGPGGPPRPTATPRPSTRPTAVQAKAAAGRAAAAAAPAPGTEACMGATIIGLQRKIWIPELYENFWILKLAATKTLSS